MLKLHELIADPGKTQKKKRVGAAKAPVRAKTSGKGHKGKQARSGVARALRSRAGRCRMIRRLPKFGFSNARFRVARGEGHADPSEQFEDGATVDFAPCVKRAWFPSKSNTSRCWPPAR